jgi:hypothetical protein
MASQGDIFEVVFGGRQHGQDTRNVVHFRVRTTSGSGAPTDAQLEAAILAGVWVNGMRDEMRQQLSSEWSLLFTKAQRLSPGPRSAGVVSVEDAGPGSIPGNALPTAVAAVIQKRTAFAGRRYRGRMYVPGIPASYENDSSLSAEGVTAMEQLANNLDQIFVATAAAVAFTFEPILLHRDVQGGYTLVTGHGVDSVLRTQRRRQVGKGS